MIRMTMTRPTIDSAQVHPDAGSIPTLVNRPWNMTRTQLTPVFSQSRMNNAGLPSSGRSFVVGRPGTPRAASGHGQEQDRIRRH